MKNTEKSRPTAFICLSPSHAPLLTAYLPAFPNPGNARCVFGLDDDLGEIDVLADLAFGELEPVFELGDLLLEQEDAGFEFVGSAGARDLGSRADAGVPRTGTSDPGRGWLGRSFLPFAEERRELGLEFGVGLPCVPQIRGADEDQVGEVDVPQPGPEREDIVIQSSE